MAIVKKTTTVVAKSAAKKEPTFSQTIKSKIKQGDAYAMAKNAKNILIKPAVKAIKAKYNENFGSVASSSKGKLQPAAMAVKNEAKKDFTTKSNMAFNRASHLYGKSIMQTTIGVGMKKSDKVKLKAKSDTNRSLGNAEMKKGRAFEKAYNKMK
jgi:hypothetical protein